MKPRKPVKGKPSMPVKPVAKPSSSFKEIRLIYVLPVLILAIALLFMRWYNQQVSTPLETPLSADSNRSSSYKSFRLHDFTFSQPLLLFENEIESRELIPMKRRINLLMNNMIMENTITTASVYVNRLSKDQWFCINPEKTFAPASLIKIPYLMIYLKKSETDPKLLDRKFTMTEKPGYIPDQTFGSKSIEMGKPYTVRELLNYMILYSDNNATYLLDKNLDYDALQKLFMDIGMEIPDLASPEFRLTVFDYSKFFQVLFGSTYLNKANSEYALSLLLKVEFYTGMMSGVPEGITVAHKFGESGKLVKGGLREFHESGIIYLPGDPILVTIFTQGSEVKTLPSAIGQITREIVDAMQDFQKQGTRAKR